MNLLLPFLAVLSWPAVEALLCSDVHELRVFGSAALDVFAETKGSRLLLTLVGRGSDSPEVRVRCRLALDDYATRVVCGVRPTDFPLWPQIDMLPKVGDEYLYFAYWPYISSGNMRKVGLSRGPPYWDDWRYGTVVYVRKLACEGKTRKEIVALLDRMAVAERAWYKYCGHQPVYEGKKWHDGFNLKD